MPDAARTSWSGPLSSSRKTGTGSGQRKPTLATAINSFGVRDPDTLERRIGDLSRREDELGGKTLLVVGLGQIGGRLAELAKAFDVHVVGLRRDPAAGRGAADAVHTMSELKSLLPGADFVALTCPLTKETEKLIDAEALGRMKPSAHLVNVARGRVVDEVALVEALAARRIAG